MSWFVWNYDLIDRAVRLGFNRVKPGDFSSYIYDGRPIIAAEGDECFPSDCSINDTLPHVVFAQNYDGTPIPGTRVFRVPIGLDYHTIARSGGWGEPRTSPEDQEEQLIELVLSSRTTRERIPRVACDFHHSDTAHAGFKRYLQWGEDRASIFAQIKESGVVDPMPRMRRSDLWKVKTDYAFSVSPHGNGLDCHRTWEDLILGLIVIVKTSSLDPLYEGLPVRIVKDWSEITADNLNRWLKELGWMFEDNSSRERLTGEWWEERMKEAITNAAAA